jgi:glycosyltransferase involved in cell wall biosynthesis
MTQSQINVPPETGTAVARPRYTVITPAKNEEAYIGHALKAMVAQTVPPVKWVVVSDGSTDRTDEIVQGYAAKHPWIELYRRPQQENRSFASKAQAIRDGVARLRGLDYEVIVNLDADVSFGPDYFDFLLGKFAANSKLGVAGTAFQDPSLDYDYRFTSIEHVAGPCQVFRRACFEEIGGYVPVKGGGIDVIAVLTARMKGWETRTFPERTYQHHREMGTAKSGLLMARFKDGHKDYNLGAHPLWELFRVTYQMTKPPLLLGGCALFAGWFWCVIRRVERPVPRELVAFRRRDQMGRLKRFVGRMLGRKPPGAPAVPSECSGGAAR